MKNYKKCRAELERRTEAPKAAVKKLAGELASAAGKAGGVLVKKAAVGKKSFLKGFNEGRGPEVLTAVPVETPEEQFLPVLEELKAICEISGLTKAVNEMNAASLYHSRDPVVARVIGNIAALPPSGKEALSRVFLNRLSLNPLFSGAMSAFPAETAELTGADPREIASAFIGCAADALEDAGFAREDCDHLLLLSDEISRPLHELLESYLKPKTALQKLRRLWKIQRLFFRTIMLVKKANAFIQSQARQPSAAFLNEKSRRQPGGLLK